MNLEKINRLAEQALAAPEPEPTFTPPKPAGPPSAATPDAAPVATAPAPADQAETVDTSSGQHQSDPELMGDDAVTVTDRSRALQSTFGIVQTAAGRDGKYDKKKHESQTP